MTGYVYFIGAGTAVKIGIANNPRQRMNDLQIGSRDRLTLLHVIETNDPRRLERELHHRFKAQRIGGEWFSLDDADLQSVRHARRVDFKPEGEKQPPPPKAQKTIPPNAKVGTYKAKGIEYLRYWWREKGTRKISTAYIGKPKPAGATVEQP